MSKQCQMEVGQQASRDRDAVSRHNQAKAIHQFKSVNATILKIQKRLRRSLTRQQHQSGQQFKLGSSEFQTLCVAACSSRESSLTLEIIIGSGLRHKDNEHEDEHGTCRILQCSNAHTSGVKGPTNQFKI